jgi:hypothetical protein
VIWGRSFDARRLLERARGGSAAPRDRTIHLDVGEIIVADRVRLTRAAGVVRLASGRIQRAGGSARIGASVLRATLRRRGENLRLTARASDAGALARALGIETSLSGGRAWIDGSLAEDLSFIGRARVHDLVIDRPSLELSAVSATSISGIIDLIRGDGIHFDRADVSFSSDGDRLAVSSAVFKGGPIGLSTRGEIDLATGHTDLVARVAPLDDLNRLIRAIPLLGRLLAPEGDGLIFAPAYSVEGDLEDADLRLRPRSLLPAFIRRLFD